MSDMLNSTMRKAEDLQIGEKFVAVGPVSGKRFFGIRIALLPGYEQGLWYVDLLTGELAILPGLLVVEVLDSFIELMVRIHEVDMKPVESISDALEFLGIDRGDIWD